MSNKSTILWLFNLLFDILILMISLTGFGYMILDKYQIPMTILLIMCLFILSYISKDFSWGKIVCNEKILFFLFTLLIIISISWSYDADLTKKYAIYFGLYTILLSFDFSENKYIHIVSLIKKIAIFDAITVLLSLVIGGSYLNIFGFLYRDTNGVWRMLSQGLGTGITGVSSYAAFIINIGLGFYISKIFVIRKLKRKDVVSAIICTLGILATGKRTVLIGVVLVTFIMALLSVDKKRFITLLKYGIAVLVVLILSVIFIPKVQVMFTRLADAMGDTDLNNRRVFWENGLLLFLKNPIKGCGFGSYSSFDKYEGTGYGYSAHNIYLETLAELGIIGIILLLILFTCVLYKAMRLLRSKKSISSQSLSICSHFVFYGILSYLFYGLMETPMYSFSLEFIFVILLCIMSSIYNRNSKTKKIRFVLK